MAPEAQGRRRGGGRISCPDPPPPHTAATVGGPGSAAGRLNPATGRAGTSGRRKPRHVLGAPRRRGRADVATRGPSPRSGPRRVGVRRAQGGRAAGGRGPEAVNAQGQEPLDDEGPEARRAVEDAELRLEDVEELVDEHEEQKVPQVRRQHRQQVIGEEEVGQRPREVPGEDPREPADLVPRLLDARDDAHATRRPTRDEGATPRPPALPPCLTTPETSRRRRGIFATDP